MALIESRVYNRLNDPRIEIPLPTKIPMTEEMIQKMNEAGRAPWVLETLREATKGRTIFEPRWKR